MRIGFIGASVTAQRFRRTSGELTGYSEFLRLKLAEKFENASFYDFSYPGNRLSDAGLLKLNEVLNCKLDYLIVEPLVENNTLGVDSTEAEIRYFYQSLLVAGIKVVTLLLPSGENCIIKNRYYELLRTINEEYNIPIIEIEVSNKNVAGWFSGVHTTPEGAAAMGKIILQKLEFYMVYNFPVPFFDSSHQSVFIQRIPKTKDNEILERSLTISARSSGSMRVIQRSKIGPYSPVLETHVFNQIEQSNKVLYSSVWDPYCHYERAAYVNIIPSNDVELGTTIYLIKISQNPPRYNSCRRSDIVWPKVDELTLKATDDAFVISNFPIRNMLLR